MHKEHETLANFINGESLVKAYGYVSTLFDLQGLRAGKFAAQDVESLDLSHPGLGQVYSIKTPGPWLGLEWMGSFRTTSGVEFQVWRHAWWPISMITQPGQVFVSPQDLSFLAYDNTGWPIDRSDAMSDTRINTAFREWKEANPARVAYMKADRKPPKVEEIAGLFPTWVQNYPGPRLRVPTPLHSPFGSIYTHLTAHGGSLDPRTPNHGEPFQITNEYPSRAADHAPAGTTWIVLIQARNLTRAHAVGKKAWYGSGSAFPLRWDNAEDYRERSLWVGMRLEDIPPVYLEGNTGRLYT